MKKEHYEKIIEELIKLIDEGVYIVDKQCIGRFYNDIMAVSYTHLSLAHLCF